jgi:hypothetical protein
MARRPAETLEFTVEDLAPVVELMDALEPAGGWLTLRPAFDAESAPPPRRGMGFFTARGPYIPVATWVPGERTRQGVAYTALGLQHGVGGPIVRWMAERGHPLIEGGEVIEDHPGRGLVVAVPPASDHRLALEWLIDAADLVCAIQLTGEWQVNAHRR